MWGDANRGTLPRDHFPTSSTHTHLTPSDTKTFGCPTPRVRVGDGGRCAGGVFPVRVGVGLASAMLLHVHRRTLSGGLHMSERVNELA